MVLTFRSTISETFKLIGEDSDGSRRVAIATKNPAHQRQWDLELTHPSGRNWQGTFHGPNVLDALSELLNSKDIEYKQERNRGHRPEPSQFDYNRRLPDDGNIAPIVPSIPNNRK
jgi:hypothetical protein